MATLLEKIIEPCRVIFVLPRKQCVARASEKPEAVLGSALRLELIYCVLLQTFMQPAGGWLPAWPHTKGSQAVTAGVLRVRG